MRVQAAGIGTDTISSAWQFVLLVCTSDLSRRKAHSKGIVRIDFLLSVVVRAQHSGRISLVII